MRIVAVIENSTTCGLPTEHGLSLWVEACGTRFFFDLGQGPLFAANARAMGIEVDEAEFAIVSHGHYDHGGGIAAFLARNSHAPVYLSAHAFAGCHSLREGKPHYIGLDEGLRGNSRIRLVSDRVTPLARGLTLFAGSCGHPFFSPANRRILKREGGELLPDDFGHEQSLIVEEGDRRLLIAGCAHSGIVGIVERAEQIVGAPLTHVVAGFHLTGVSDTTFIDGLARALLAHSCHYHTCHCTGPDAYARLKATMGDRIGYLACGDELVL